MDTEKLRGVLDQLHAELSRELPMDDERRALLLEIRQEVEQLLARSPGEMALPVPEQQHLEGRLQAAAVGFEGSHPQLASLLEQAFNVLSNLGL